MNLNFHARRDIIDLVACDERTLKEKKVNVLDLLVTLGKFVRRAMSCRRPGKLTCLKNCSLMHKVSKEGEFPRTRESREMARSG